jgi:hypothetical protein
MEAPMEKTNTSKSLIFAMGIALLVGTIGFFRVGGKESGRAQAGKGRTTETTAAVTGAQVTPTEPKLRVEPK